VILIFVLSLADVLLCAWFIYILSDVGVVVQTCST
jgi:hypothetical protein